MSESYLEQICTVSWGWGKNQLMFCAAIFLSVFNFHLFHAVNTIEAQIITKNINVF